MNLNYTQEIIIPNQGKFFWLSFNLSSISGDEVFMRLIPPTEDIYTFNTADLIKRFKYENRDDCYGENSVPIVGGFMQNFSSNFMHIYPNFPVGLSMDPFSISLHLHRNPQYDDVLGLGEPLNDPLPAFHNFYITFDDLNQSKILKNYLNHRNQVLSLSSHQENSKFQVNLDLAQVKTTQNYAKLPKKFLNSNDCLYLSRVFTLSSNLHVSVMNTCEYPVQFSFDRLIIIQETLLNGQNLSTNDLNLNQGEQIQFSINNNIPENIIKLKSNEALNDFISPFELKTFQVLDKGFNADALDVSIGFQGFLDIKNKISSSTWQDFGYFFILVATFVGLPLFLILTLGSLKSRKKLD